MEKDDILAKIYVRLGWILFFVILIFLFVAC